jgi:hypothetical protein
MTSSGWSIPEAAFSRQLILPCPLCVESLVSWPHQTSITALTPLPTEETSAFPLPAPTTLVQQPTGAATPLPPQRSISIKKALSHSQIQPPPMAKTARSGSMSSSTAPPEANPRGICARMSAACPTRMSIFGDHPLTILSTIPPTPSVVESSHNDGMMSPFKNNTDYFAFDMAKQGEKGDKHSSADDDPMQL